MFDNLSPRMERIMDKLGFNLLLVAKVIVILIAAFLIERLLFILIRRGYKRSTQGREDATRYKFLKNALRFIVVLVTIGAIIYVIPSIKHMAVTLFAGAGILVAILGLATQRAFSNIISGIFIVSFKPFRVGDIIKIGAMHSGAVEDITLRHTVILTFENRRVIVPNSIISEETIINSSIEDEATCQFVEVSISYESDLDLAMSIMQQEAEAHPACMDRRPRQELESGMTRVVVRLITLGESSILLRAFVWAADPIIARQMQFDLFRSIKLRFDREGIVIPYPQRTITFKGPVPKELLNGNGGTVPTTITTDEEGTQALR
ncbi:MAG: mechanosensitive ion channel family protein [Bacteroidota bacterium]|nr:mechanosensitive ion channel family protein [Bacteroidota bacterium]